MDKLDKELLTLINRIETEDNTYTLFTTNKDFNKAASFRVLDNGDYELRFSLEEGDKFDSDYIFTLPIALGAVGKRILIMGYHISSFKETLSNKPRSYSLNVKEFQSETDSEMNAKVLWRAFFSVDGDIIPPHRTGLIFSQNDKVTFEVQGIQVNLYFVQDKNSKKTYYVFSSTSQITFEKFKSYVDVAVVTFGFISGFYLANSVYYLGYNPIGNVKIKYKNISQSFHSQSTVIERGFYSEIPESDLKLTPRVFSKLFEIMYLNQEYNRATLLLLHAGNTINLSKASIAAVALETITKKIMTSTNTEKIIEDKKIDKGFRYDLRLVLDKYHGILTKEQIDTFKVKLNQINTKPNSQKLEDAFALLDIDLTEDDLFCLKCRNQLLHGGVPKMFKEFNLTEEELLNVVSERLIMLSSMILLKLSGFKGKIADRGLSRVIKMRMINSGERIPGGDILRSIG